MRKTILLLLTTIVLALVMVGGVTSRTQAQSSTTQDVSTTPEVAPADSTTPEAITAETTNGSNAEICKMNADGSNQVQLTNDPARSYSSPTWSPDGTKIAYNDFDSNGNIRVMKSDGTEQILLTPRGTLPDWSPVNNQIVFASNRDGNLEIYKMNADGSAQTRLTTDTAQSQQDTAPAFSADGTQIVFQSNGEGSANGKVYYEIYKMNADGSGQTRLTTNPPPPLFNGLWDFAPDWAPDGGQIVFHANKNTRNEEIYVINAEGSDPKNLTNTADGVADRHPDWQPLNNTAPPSGSTPPTLNLPDNITVEATDPSGAQVSWQPPPTATDDVDGSVPVSCTKGDPPVAVNSGDTFPLGTTTVTCQATDAAGNTANGSFDVTVNYTFSGFFQPVDDPPTTNLAKAGIAIPVKFSLGGDQGLDIFEAGYPHSGTIPAAPSASLDNIEQTISAGANSLSYDAANDQYTYVWKTDKAWSGQTRQLVLKLTDGSEHKANFQFR